MGKIIDEFAHVLPSKFAEELYKAHPTEELKELASLGYFSDIEARVRILDRTG